ncbi:MAG TPA: putative metal-binding motif-containing protein [Kofleriaceae bacterium]|nr:putative metal-binding motif-containing protein [Kofleriaceae bacterium]
MLVGSCARADSSAPGSERSPLPVASVHRTATPIVATLAAASRWIRIEAEESHTRHTVAERTAMLAAWAAVDATASLSVSWRDRIAAPVSSELVVAAIQLYADTAELVAAGPPAIVARAAIVYAGARAIALALAAPDTRATPELPAMTPAGCTSRAQAVLADLGGLATTELVIGTTRAGLPWVGLSPSEVMARIDREKLVRPAWSHARPGLDAAAVAHSRAALVRELGGDVSAARPAIDAFERASQAGFEPHTALALAEDTVVSGAWLVQLEAEVKTQLEAITRAPDDTVPDFLQVGALVGGMQDGARARSAALAAARPPGIVHDLEATWTDDDRGLDRARRELQACALMLDGGSVHEASVTGLAMITAYRAPGRSRSCERDADCAPAMGDRGPEHSRCVAVVDRGASATRLCLGVGWQCGEPDDCGPGLECDRSIGQCVDREAYRCGAGNPCRWSETCGSRPGGARCEVNRPGLAKPCERNDDHGRLLQGECRKGTWMLGGHDTLGTLGTLRCVVHAPEAEVCDGRDNNCNGVIDDTAIPCVL